MSVFKGKKYLWEDQLNWLKMAKEFDLIPANKLCDMFRVEFDLYTPRAYLSILARDESIKTYYELDDEAKPKVVESALSIVTGYNL